MRQDLLKGIDKSRVVGMVSETEMCKSSMENDKENLWPRIERPVTVHSIIANMTMQMHPKSPGEGTFGPAQPPLNLDPKRARLLVRFPLLFVFCRVYMLYLKLALALIYSLARSNLEDQAVMFWGVITFWTVWSCTHPPYRCRSSNRRDFKVVLRRI